MPSCEFTLGYIDPALSDLDEVHSSQSPPHSVRSDSEEELEGMEEEDLKNHMVVEESIASARREEEEVNHAVEGLLESLHENRLCAWLRPKKKGLDLSATPNLRALMIFKLPTISFTLSSSAK
jgi:hypothetical protein